MADPNLALLHAMVLALGSLRERLVFVGGCATGLLLTNPAAAGVRPTEDVDAIVEVATLAGYHALHPLLAERGFRQTMEDNTPPFRWFWNRLQLDLVPVDEHVLGFANHNIATKATDAGFNKKIIKATGSGERVLHLEERPGFVAKNRYGMPPSIAFPKVGGWDVFEASLTEAMKGG